MQDMYNELFNESFNVDMHSIQGPLSIGETGG